MSAPISIATAVLVRNGRVLMAHRRSMRQAYPDRWALPGGHVEPGELCDEAVSRECLEEVGICIVDPRPIPMGVDDANLDMTCFLVTRWIGEPENAAPDEHDELRWFTPNQLARLELAHPETLPNLVSAIATASTQ